MGNEVGVLVGVVVGFWVCGRMGYRRGDGVDACWDVA